MKWGHSGVLWEQRDPEKPSTPRLHLPPQNREAIWFRAQEIHSGLVAQSIPTFERQAGGGCPTVYMQPAHAVTCVSSLCLFPIPSLLGRKFLSKCSPPRGLAEWVTPRGPLLCYRLSSKNLKQRVISTPPTEIKRRSLGHKTWRLCAHWGRRENTETLTPCTLSLYLCLAATCFFHLYFP